MSDTTAMAYRTATANNIIHKHTYSTNMHSIYTIIQCNRAMANCIIETKFEMCEMLNALLLQEISLQRTLQSHRRCGSGSEASS